MSRLPAFNMGFQLFNGIYYPLAGPAPCFCRRLTHSIAGGAQIPARDPGPVQAHLGSMPEPFKGRHLPRGWLAEACRTPASVALREHLAEGA